LIALRGRGICRAERLLGPAALRAETRVKLIVQLEDDCSGGESPPSDAPRSVYENLRVSLPCRRLAVDRDPRRTAVHVQGIVRESLNPSGSQTGPGRPEDEPSRQGPLE
ncbi:MAG: hypothetical protein M0009_06165, partial [Deltaproteobacteria bacterium]|nr:hypothetical protein [Deltaproteobacteria bacterium]